MSLDDSIVKSSKPMALIGKKKLDILHTPAQKVGDVDKEVLDLAARMLSTVRKNGGYALAANQVGIPINLIVLRDGHVYVDVEYKGVGDSDDDIQEESCLSLPGKTFLVPRYLEIEWSATKLNNDSISKNIQEFEARMWQHEADHLQGKLLSDYAKEVFNRGKVTS